MTSVLTWVGVGLGGGLGAVARFLLDRAVMARMDGRFPAGILLVNVSGAFLLGLLAGLSTDHRLTLVLGGGVLGGYTTFSTWMVESHALSASGRRDLAVANVLGSLLAGLGAVALGHALGGA